MHQSLKQAHVKAAIVLSNAAIYVKNLEPIIEQLFLLFKSVHNGLDLLRCEILKKHTSSIITNY